MQYSILVTNDCPSPRFINGLRWTTKRYASRLAAQTVADKWTAHAVPYNQIMRQNVVYTVVECAK
jgi:hypothetical protein